MPAKGTTLTPEQRANCRPKNMTQEAIDRRASNAGKASQTPAVYARKLVRSWPKLNSEQQNTIRTVLRPVIGGGNG
jgi:hypothetical protein